MPWAHIDDRFPWNWRVRFLSDGAFRLYVSAICWSAGNPTGGVITTKELRLVVDARAPRRQAEELVAAELFEELPGVGWRVQDYHDEGPVS